MADSLVNPGGRRGFFEFEGRRSIPFMVDKSWRATLKEVIEQLEVAQRSAKVGGANMLAFKLKLALEEARAELRSLGAEIVALSPRK